MLKITDLDFEFPSRLVATTPAPRGASRIFMIPRSAEAPGEITWAGFYELFNSGDCLILNDSKVLWARLPVQKKTGARGELFFLRQLEDKDHWEVLTRGMRLQKGTPLILPGGAEAEVLATGYPARVSVKGVQDLPSYFAQNGQVPLPPYILGQRESRHEPQEQPSDRERYQTIWAKNWGSVAAPTASLHFGPPELQRFQTAGVELGYVTLHVGAGTFLPIETETLEEFQIHAEHVVVTDTLVELVEKTKAQGGRVWACGTTALRALETSALKARELGLKTLLSPFEGETRLFVTPGFKFQVVDCLLTNFHQPRSSLLALAAAFASPVPADTDPELSSLEKIKGAYSQAFHEKFRLFSYGDLTVIK